MPIGMLTSRRLGPPSALSCTRARRHERRQPSVLTSQSQLYSRRRWLPRWDGYHQEVLREARPAATVIGSQTDEHGYSGPSLRLPRSLPRPADGPARSEGQPVSAYPERRSSALPRPTQHGTQPSLTLIREGGHRLPPTLQQHT